MIQDGIYHSGRSCTSLLIIYWGQQLNRLATESRYSSVFSLNVKRLSYYLQEITPIINNQIKEANIDVPGLGLAASSYFVSYHLARVPTSNLLE